MVNPLYEKIENYYSSLTKRLEESLKKSLLCNFTPCCNIALLKKDIVQTGKAKEITELQATYTTRKVLQTLIRDKENQKEIIDNLFSYIDVLETSIILKEEVEDNDLCIAIESPQYNIYGDEAIGYLLYFMSKAKNRHYYMRIDGFNDSIDCNYEPSVGDINLLQCELQQEIIRLSEGITQ